MSVDASAAAPVRVRFVVVAWGRSEGLDACLDAIERVRTGAPGAPGAIACETVVVLAPGDPAAVPAARRPGVRVEVPDGKDGAPHTPGANRNRGARAATAPFLAFVDGDAVIDPSFVVRALERLTAEPALGGVGGRVHERQWKDGRIVREIPDSYRSGAGGRVEMLATAWIARRSAFEEVGGFDARLGADEDADLSLRLADAGHPLVALDACAAYHDGPPRPSWAEFRRRWRTGLYAGQGALLRLSWGTPRFARHLARQVPFLAALAFALLGGAGAVAAAFGVPGAGAALALWTAAAAFVVLVMAVRKGSLSLGALAVLAWVVLGAGIARAWILGPVRGPRRG